MIYYRRVKFVCFVFMHSQFTVRFCDKHKSRVVKDRMSWFCLGFCFLLSSPFVALFIFLFQFTEWKKPWSYILDKFCRFRFPASVVQAFFFSLQLTMEFVYRFAGAVFQDSGGCDYSMFQVSIQEYESMFVFHRSNECCRLLLLVVVVVV